MSQNQNSLLMPVDQAANVQEQVYQDVFFNKLAAAGFAPTTKEAAVAMLNTAAQIREVEQVAQTKSASADPFVLADQELANMLGQHGVSGHAAKQAEDAELDLAVAYAQMPDVYRSALTLTHAQNAG